MLSSTIDQIMQIIKYKVDVQPNTHQIPSYTSFHADSVGVACFPRRYGLSQRFVIKHTRTVDNTMIQHLLNNQDKYDQYL